VYDGILFDVDGVLVANPDDHPEPYSEAGAEALRSFGVDPTEEDLDPFYGPGKSLEGMEAVCERYDLDVAEVWPERERQATALQQRMIEDGLRDTHEDAAVIDALAEDYSIGLVSNNQIATIEWFAEHFGIADAVDVIEARRPSVEGFRRGKPNPYYVEQALGPLDVDTAVMVGDRASDVVAADRAGIDAAFIWRDQGEVSFEVEPTYELESLENLPNLLAEASADRPGSDAADATSTGTD